MNEQDTRPFAMVGMTQAERKVLLDLVRQEAPDLLHPGAVKRIRRGTWELISKKFNESTSCTRSVAQLKSCLQNIMRKTLQKKAGGGATQQSLRKINFTAFEKSVILNLGKQHSIVFSKLKDGKTQANKRKAWNAMMWAFNRTQGITTQRTAREIKNCMVNMTNRNREVDEFLKSQMPEYERQSDVYDQSYLEGTVVLGGVPHPVTNVHGTNAPANVTPNPLQSPTGSKQSEGTMANSKTQQVQSKKSQISKHRFLLPKPPGVTSPSNPNQATPVLLSAVSQSVPTSLTTIPQSNRSTHAHPVRTISVPQVSMTSSQLSPPVSTLQTKPSQTLSHPMLMGPAPQVQSSQTQSLIPVQTLTTPLVQPSQPITVHPSQSHGLPPQNSVLESSDWIPDSPSPPQNPPTRKPAADETLADPEDDCIIEIKEESNSEPDEVYSLEHQSSSAMEIHQSVIDSSQVQRYGDPVMNSDINQLEQIPPAKSTTPQQPEDLSGESVHIQVHRDGAMNHTNLSMITEGTGENSRRVGQNQATSSTASSSYTAPLPIEQHNPSGYLIQTTPQFSSQSQLLSHDSSCSTTGLTTDLSPEMQDSGIHRSEPSRDGNSSRRARLKRRKESVGTLKKRLLQREHDLRVQMMREEHTWLLEEHMWKREEHELRMNIIRINSKFS